MEIILMRHGKPACATSLKVTSREMPQWVAQYHLSETGNDMPPASARLLASGALQVISSPLPRTLSSLRTLGREPDLIDDVFREADLPLFPFPALRLSPLHWATLFRLLWLCGISRNTESFGMAKKRAAQAAGILIKRARETNGPVLLMGHGVMNRIIAKELMSQGWKVHSRPGQGYWNAAVYRL